MKPMMKLSSSKSFRASILTTLLSLSIGSQAEILPKQGISLAELKALAASGSAIEINYDENTREVQFAGAIPKRCLDDHEGQSAQAFVHHEAGTQFLVLRMPGCEANPQRVAGDVDVSMSERFGKISLQDISGKVKLRSFAKGDKAQRSRNKDEDLVAFHLQAKKQMAISIESEADKAEGLVQKAKKEKKQEQDSAAEAALKRMEDMCDRENFAGLGKEIERNAKLFRDVGDTIGRVNQLQKDKFLKDLEKAETGEAAAAVFAAYLEAAAKFGWDEKALNEPYYTKRMSLFADLRTDKSISSTKISKELDRFAKEIKRVDRKLFQAKQSEIAKEFAELGVREEKAKNKAVAIELYEKAKDYADAEGSLKLDGRIMKIHAGGFEQCLKKNPGKFELCEKRHIDEAREVADRIKEDLGSRAEDDEKAAEEFATFSGYYNQTFGAGPVWNIQGYGSHRPYFPGALEMSKYQAVQQYQMQMQQNQWMHYQRHMYGYGR